MKISSSFFLWGSRPYSKFQRNELIIPFPGEKERAIIASLISRKRWRGDVFRGKRARPKFFPPAKGEPDERLAASLINADNFKKRKKKGKSAAVKPRRKTRRKTDWQSVHPSNRSELELEQTHPYKLLRLVMKTQWLKLGQHFPIPEKKRLPQIGHLLPLSFSREPLTAHPRSAAARKKGSNNFWRVFSFRSLKNPQKMPKGSYLEDFIPSFSQSILYLEEEKRKRMEMIEGILQRPDSRNPRETLLQTLLQTILIILFLLSLRDSCINRTPAGLR